MKFHTPKTLNQIYKITKKYNLLFIADECATGFYRTGKKLAIDYAEIKPDIMVVGKALTGGAMTLAATLVSEEIYKSFLSNSLDTALMHGPTFMGNPLACAAANASLDLFEKENYEEKTLAIEKFLKKELEKIDNFPRVKNVRALGAVGVIETDFSLAEIFELRKKFIAQNIFLRPFSNCIYLMPALNIKKSELKKITRSILVTLETKGF